jgi:hypothetical protein
LGVCGGGKGRRGDRRSSEGSEAKGPKEQGKLNDHYAKLKMSIEELPESKLGTKEQSVSASYAYSYI